MMKNTRVVRSVLAMILVVVTLATLFVGAFAASDIYFKRYTGSSGSIVTALNAIGVDSSYSNRSKIAAANSIANYRGAADQNVKMLQLLKAGKLIDPAKKAAAESQSSNQTNNQNGTTYFKKYTGSSGSIVTALNAIGADSSYSNRSKIAAANGISGYSGTAAQNTKMLQLLKAGKLINPAKGTSGNSGTTTKPTAPTTPAKPTTPAGEHAAPVYNTAGYKMTAYANVQLRTSARIWGAVYATLEKGTLVTVTGTLKNIYGSWYRLKFNGTECYVQQSQLTAASSLTYARLVKVTKAATLRNAPYDTGAAVKNLQVGTILHTVGTYTNKHGNLWYAVKLQNQNALYYIYGGNVSKSYTNDGSIYLNVATQFQTTNYTCSAAAAQAVLRYYNTALDVADTTLYSSTGGVVYKTTNTVNQYLGNAYRYNTFYSVAAYEQAIRASLSQGSPVIARVKFSKGYFNYSSGGHYTTIIGIYTDGNGKTWVQLADSFVNRYSSNSYSNAQTGIVNVPIATMYQYGKYNGASDVYLIYND